MSRSAVTTLSFLQLTSTLPNIDLNVGNRASTEWIGSRRKRSTRVSKRRRIASAREINPTKRTTLNYERYALAEANVLELLQNYWTVGKERTFDQGKDLALKAGITEIGCDQESILRTSAVEVLPGLLLVGLCGATRRPEKPLGILLNHNALQSFSSLAAG